MGFFQRVRKSQKVQRFLMHLAYWTGVVRLFYFLNRKAKRIVTFHNVLPDELYHDNLADGSAWPVNRFLSVMKWISRRFAVSTDLTDASTVTIAFDDGYCCQAEIAGNVLRECGNMPAIVFAAGGAIRAEKPEQALVIDKLLFWTSYAPIEALSKYYGSPVTRRTEDFWSKRLWFDYCNDGESLGERICARLDEIHPFSRIFESLDLEYLRLRMTGIPYSLRQEMIARGWMFAWHTEHHHPLAFLSENVARREMTPPAEELIKLPFSYPYGSLETTSLRDEKIAEELGYPCAVCNTSPNERERHGRHFMTRLSLSDNRIYNECVMSGFKYFIETGRLLHVAFDGSEKH